MRAGGYRIANSAFSIPSSSSQSSRLEPPLPAPALMMNAVIDRSAHEVEELGLPARPERAGVGTTKLTTVLAGEVGRLERDHKA